jgi:HK97 family phage major capsid protein
MSIAVIEKLSAERDEARGAAIAIAESDDFNPEDKTFVELQSRAVDLDSRIGALAKLLEDQSEADGLFGRVAKQQQQRQQQQQQTPALESRESWGDTFVRSDEFKGYRGRGTSAMFTLDADSVQQRALPTGIAELVAAGLKGTPYSVDTTAPAPPTPLMDNVTQVQVSGNAIEYIAWAKIAGGATKVPEKSPKPSAEWAPVVTPTTLDTFAVYTQLTRQLLEDAPAVRSLIDSELRRDVARAEEADATAVLAAAGAAIPDVTADDLLSSIRVGIGTVQAAGYQAGAVLLNPADWAALDVDVYGSTLNGPTIGQRFWGLTPIASTSQPAGTAVVGDFRAAVHHYFRSAISLYISDSHGDTFLSNVFTLLCERRSKTVVVRPQALVQATATVIP